MAFKQSSEEPFKVDKTIKRKSNFMELQQKTQNYLRRNIFCWGLMILATIFTGVLGYAFQI